MSDEISAQPSAAPPAPVDNDTLESGQGQAPESVVPGDPGMQDASLSTAQVEAAGQDAAPITQPDEVTPAMMDAKSENRVPASHAPAPFPRPGKDAPEFIDLETSPHVIERQERLARELVGSLEKTFQVGLRHQAPRFYEGCVENNNALFRQLAFLNIRRRRFRLQNL